MWRFTAIFLLTAACLYQVRAVQSSCEDLSDLSGNITDIYPGPRNYRYYKCWNILNPDNQLLEIKLKELDFEQKSCSYVYLTVTANRTGKSVKWCEDDSEKEPITIYSNVTVYFFVDYSELTPNTRKNFELHYRIDNTIKGVEGVQEARRQAVYWLKSNSSSWKWINHIPKAVTALALAEGAEFDGKNLKEELMVKQRELRISVSLLRDRVSSEQLSTFVNSVVSTCHNPRSFYGHNLVELLKRQVESENVTHPASYLALCNANEMWPEKAYYDLVDTYNSISEQPFKRDLQAFAVMALSCQIRRNRNGTDIPNKEKLAHYFSKNIREFKNLQEPSGRFGNEHRTALITQALISFGQENADDWHAHRAVKYLLKSATVPPTDFLLTYLTLPLLNGKSLADIGFNNCSSSKDQDDLVAEIHDYLGPKIQIQYSLFIGDAKDVIHTIVIKVPKYFRAFDVMEFAALKDKKYKFRHELVSGKLDIYEVADIPNDPEDGKFWLFYLKGASALVFTHVSAGPDQTVLAEGDHIAMWYRKAHTFV